MADILLSVTRKCCVNFASPSFIDQDKYHQSNYNHIKRSYPRVCKGIQNAP